MWYRRSCLSFHRNTECYKYPWSTDTEFVSTFTRSICKFLTRSILYSSFYVTNDSTSWHTQTDIFADCYTSWNWFISLLYPRSKGSCQDLFRLSFRDRRKCLPVTVGHRTPSPISFWLEQATRYLGRTSFVTSGFAYIASLKFSLGFRNTFFG